MKEKLIHSVFNITDDQAREIHQDLYNLYVNKEWLIEEIIYYILETYSPLHKNYAFFYLGDIGGSLRTRMQMCTPNAN